MPDYDSIFRDERVGPDPWAGDGELIDYLCNWLMTTCVLRGHKINRAVRITDPERWRKHALATLHAGRNDDSMVVRDRVLHIIEQTEPELAAKLPAPQETHDLPDVKIAESAEDYTPK